MTVDITSLSRAVIGAVRLFGPAIAAAGAAGVASGMFTRSGRARLRLSLTGLSGTASSNAWRRGLTGLIVPALAVTVLGVSLALEQEVRTGPNRVVHQIASPAVRAGGVAWVFQRGTSHFMDDSRISGSAPLLANPPPDVWPFWSQLAIVRHGTTDQAGLLFAAAETVNGASPLSPVVDTRTAACTLSRNRCVLRADQAVADPDLAAVGTTITIRGQLLRVVAHTRRPLSLLNRAVVFVSVQLFAQPGGALTRPYGLVFAGPDAITRARRVAASLPDTEVLTQAQLLDDNSTFWAGNGTPLLLLVIALSAVFAGTSMYAGRRAAQEQARVSIGTLRSLGLSPARTCLVDLSRSILIALAAGIVASPSSALVILAVNHAILGFHAALTPLMIAAAIGVVISADAVGTAALWSHLRRASIVEAISGI